MRRLRHLQAMMLATTMTAALWIGCVGAANNGGRQVGVSQQKGEGPELVYISRLGTWHIYQRGVIRLGDTDGEPVLSMPAEIVDAVLKSDTSLEVLTPYGLYLVGALGRTLHLSQIFKSSEPLRYMRIVGCADGTWLERTAGLDLIQGGKVTLQVTSDELLKKGSGVPEPAWMKHFLPLLESDDVAGTTYLVLRSSPQTTQYVIFNHVTKKWDIQFSLNELMVAPLIRKNGGVLLLDGSGRVFPVPQGAFKDSPVRSLRNLFAQVGPSTFLVSAWGGVPGHAMSTLLVVNEDKGATPQLIRTPEEARCHVYADTTGWYAWQPSWWEGIKKWKIGHP